MKKTMFWSRMLCVPAIVVLVWLTGRGETITPAERRYEADLQARPPDTESSIQGIGFVEPVTEVRKLVFKVNGVIARCRAEVGHLYKKGEVLMELDDREQRAAISVAESDWRLAEFEREKVLSGIHPRQIESAARKVELLTEQLRYWQKEHERSKELITRGSLSRADFDKTFTESCQRKTELQQAEADLRLLQDHVRVEDCNLAAAKVKAAKAKLDLARQHQEDTILRAPCDGSVLELMKREGEGARLFDSEPVAIFGDTSRLQIRTEVDERFVDGLTAGQGAVVFGRGLGESRYPAHVVLIKKIMGKKTVFSHSASERKDLDVLQLMIRTEAELFAPVGLEVDVKIYHAVKVQK
jgi:HlyD family secretion protein